VQYGQRSYSFQDIFAECLSVNDWLRKVLADILDALEQAINIGSELDHHEENQMSPPPSLLFPRLFPPFGRLNAESTGLILLTSDGGTNIILKNNVSANDDINKVKEYHVETSPQATDENIQTLAKVGGSHYDHGKEKRWNGENYSEDLVLFCGTPERQQQQSSIRGWIKQYEWKPPQSIISVLDCRGTESSNP
jgi:hypothetical protein